MNMFKVTDHEEAIISVGKKYSFVEGAAYVLPECALHPTNSEGLSHSFHCAAPHTDVQSLGTCKSDTDVSGHCGAPPADTDVSGGCGVSDVDPETSSKCGAPQVDTEIGEHCGGAQQIDTEISTHCGGAQQND